MLGLAMDDASPSANGHDLDRFVAAQAPVFDDVLAELAAGAKRTHWMWFVFPQLASLGRSATARHFGITDLAHAQAYWRHPLLGPRLRQCCALLDALPPGATPLQVFGPVDALKLRSCLTLFERAVPDEPLFAQLLQRGYGGERDPLTLQALDGR
jgi:uncharacterized protein (DUF1810 family)